MLGAIKHRDVYRILKSERINTLRKQYDAFLEEDKKRKERNEYILGRLDKMRYSTALVPVRNIPYIRQPTCDLQISINKDQMLQNNLQARAVENTFIIQELSKSYILIPKLRSTFTNPNIQQINEQAKDVQNIQEKYIDNGHTQASAIDNNWQSKYEILNILQKEANINPSKSLPATVLSTEIPEKVTASSSCENIAKIINGNSENKYLHELPEKDVSDKNDYSVDNSESLQIYAIHENTKQFSTLPPSDTVDGIDYKLQNTNLEDSNSKISTFSDEIANYTEHDGVLNDQKNVSSVEPTFYEEQLEPSNKQDMNGKEFITIIEQKHLQSDNDCISESHFSADKLLKLEPASEVIVDEQTENAVQVINPSDIMEQTDPLNAHKANTISNVADASNSEYNNEHSFMPGIKDEEPPIEQIYEVTNTEDQEHIDQTDIQAFDAEQHEMFYTEQPAETYNIQDDVNANEQQYSQNQEHVHNQEYSYYESTQPEAYPVNLDVNEEQTLRYDPTYQQQYVESYEKSYEQQPQQNEVEQNDQSNSEQLEYIYTQESMETPEGIKTTLDTEEGYIEEQDDENFAEPPENENRQT